MKRPFSSNPKSAHRCGMETPVTYFYTDRPRDVDVNVRFPLGLLTEFYPPVRTLGPAGFGAEPAQMKDSFLDWGRVHLIPQDQFPKTRVVMSDGKHEPAKLPPVVGDDHYGFARQTDSAIVAATDQRGYVNFEKFLFYRGVGKFKLPLALEALGGGRFSVTNFGGDPIRALFLVHIEHGHVRFLQAAPLPANGVAYLEEPPADSTIDALAADMERALVEQGLYEKEARAMVNTWRIELVWRRGNAVALSRSSAVDRHAPAALDQAGAAGAGPRTRRANGDHDARARATAPGGHRGNGHLLRSRRRTDPLGTAITRPLRRAGPRAVGGTVGGRIIPPRPIRCSQRFERTTS